MFGRKTKRKNERERERERESISESYIQAENFTFIIELDNLTKGLINKSKVYWK